MFELTPYFRSNRKAAQVYDPFREMEDMERRFFGNSVQSFRSDIKDEGNAYLIETDMPGFRKEDIDLDVKDGVLTISAKHQADDRTAADNYICRERRTGSFSRSFTLDGIQEDAIRASYQDGVLELILPKRQEVLPQCHKIQIQ